MLQALCQQPKCKFRPRYVEEVQIESDRSDLANASEEAFSKGEFDVSRALQCSSGYTHVPAQLGDNTIKTMSLQCRDV